MNFLNGSKTYIVGVASIVGAWIGVWAGTIDMSVAWQTTETAILAMTVRHGVSTGT